VSHPAVDEVHWPITAIPGPESPVLQGDINADVVIVGAGLTGCRTAVGLAEAGVSVVLLDQHTVGWGASGRSGGQCNPMWRATPDELRKRFGDERAERLVQTTITSADDLFRDISTYQVNCDPVQNGWVQAAHTKTERQTLQELHSGWTKAGSRIQVLEGNEVERISGSPEYQFALFHETGGNVHPLSLTRGYAHAAVDRGARIFCGQSVDALERMGGKWKVKTASGSVTAEQVALTTNAYTRDKPSRGLRQTFLPMTSVSLATTPLSESQQLSVLPGKVTISDTRLAIYYSRYDRDGRLIFGCVGSCDSVNTLGGQARLSQGLHTVFPQLRGIALERSWAGRIAVTPEMMPHIHEPAPGVTAALGYSGRGIAMTSVMGRALSRKILGEPESSLPFPVQALKPVPLHGIVNMVLPLAAPSMSLRDWFNKATDAI